MQSTAVRKAVLNPFIRAASRSLTQLQPAAIISCRPSHVRTIHIQIPATTLLVDSDRLRYHGLSQHSRSTYQIRSYADKVVKVPPMAESISEGTLREWMKKVGDFVKQDEEVVSIETDKIDVPVNSPASGTITEVYANESDTVTVGQDLFKLELGDGPTGSTASKEGSTEKSPSTGGESQPTKESQKPQPIQKESQPEESSKAGPEKDVTKASTAPPPPKPSSPKPETTQSSKPTGTNESSSPFGSREERHVKISRMRQRIAERLKESQNTAASLTTFNEVDMSNLMELRNTYKDKFFEKHGVKLGFMSAFVKASAAALHELPAVNASIVGDEIVYHEYIDVSVAVATPKGLLTPVLRNVETMSFMQIEKEIAEMGKKARDGKITIEDMAGGTFTISNGGVFGSLMGTPIINMPQTAILGMHAVKERPMVVNGKIEIRPMMYVALTYDHRLIDGREGVLFLVKLKEAIEDPRRLLLEV